MAKKPAAKVEKKPKRKAVTGFAPLKFKDFTITQKRSGRYQVVTTKGAAVNGKDKETVLLDAKVLKGSFKKNADAAAPAAE